MIRKRIVVKEKYRREILNFEKSPKYVGRPEVLVILKSPIDDYEAKFAKRFFLDTGASISIINSNYKSFINHLKPKDKLLVKYGGGKSKKLPVYDIILIIKGIEFKSTVAYDEELPYLLLGNYDFFENFDYNIFNSIESRCRLIKN
jgi:hypothetical protein